MKAATKNAKSKPAKKGGKAPADLGKVYDALFAILQRYEGRLKWKEYGKDYYYLETQDKVFRGKPMCCGGVRLGKNYVSYYLMTVYASPELLKGMSPELKKRMQGKACFNFTSVDAGLFAELETLTKVGFERFAKMDWKKFEESLKSAKP